VTGRRKDRAIAGDELRRRLSEGEAPGEREAGGRAWRVVEAAYGSVPRRGWRRRSGSRVALAVAVAALALAAVLTPAGADVREWIGDTLDPGEDSARPTLTRLPTEGRLLVTSRAGAWVVHRDGGLRRLGSYTGAGWSPAGLYVVVTRGRRLTAIEPDGTVRWSFARRRPVSHPAWSPGDGFRIAYIAGRSLRVVSGDGRDDHALRSEVAPLTPTWRPGPGYVVTFVDGRGRIATLEADSGRRIWTYPPAGGPLRLEWTRNGRLLVALLRHSLVVLGHDGRPRIERRLPRGTLAETMAVHPSGRRVAVVTSGRAASAVLSVPLDRVRSRPRRLFAARGRFTDLTWSPDGSRLLVAWRDADRWILLRPDGRDRVSFSRIANQFDPGATGETSFPRIAGWCCAEAGG
jgi:hypothetical protein